MAATVPIYEGQDFYVPHFEVRVGDRPLDREAVHDITEVTYRESLEEIDGFDITISNWDAGSRTYKYGDRDLFDPGRKLELWMGYRGRDRLKLMVTGEITDLKPNFPAGGQPTLVVSGLNLLHRLRRTQVSDSYTNVKDSDVAQRIAGRLSVTIDTPNAAAEDQHDYLFQDNKYDIVFLLERARRIGYDLFVVEQQGAPRLYFGPSARVRDVTYRLSYGRSLIQLQPSLTTARQVGKVTVRGWDQAAKQKLEATATRQDLATSRFGAGAAEDPGNAFGDREEVIADRPVNSAAEARTLAIETLERIAKDMVTASGSVVGLPDLRAGRVVRIDGVGRRFSGRYFVTATTHTIGESGYTTQFECRREEL